MSRPFQNRQEPGARASDYEYDLPPELIATHPAPRREESRLLVYHRAAGRVEHRHFYDLPDYLGADDLLVLNDSKVSPAALTTSDGRLEVLLLEETREMIPLRLFLAAIIMAFPGTSILSVIFLRAFLRG